jgi:hypothetical protein
LDFICHARQFQRREVRLARAIDVLTLNPQARLH